MLYRRSSFCNERGRANEDCIHIAHYQSKEKSVGFTKFLLLYSIYNRIN